MEQPVANKNYATYIGGLFTEATPLNFPDNTVQFSQNFRYDPAGYIERRLGLEVETCGIIESSSKGECIVSQTFRWQSVSNRKDLDIIVFQKGNLISLYIENTVDCYERVCAVDLIDFKVPTATGDILRQELVSFAYGNGSLFVTGKYVKPFRLDYTPDNTTTLCTEQPEVGCKTSLINLQERDFKGLEDGVSMTEHPTELTNEHLYNLLNRGWSIEYIYRYFDEVQQYPSKAEYQHLGWFTNNDADEEWSVEELRRLENRTTSASQGHIIQGVFDTCREDEDDVDYAVDVVDIIVDRDTQTVTIKTAIPHRLTDPSTDVADLFGGNGFTNQYATITANGGTKEEQFILNDQVYDIDGIYNPYTIIDDRTISFPISPTFIAGDYLYNDLIGYPIFRDETYGQLRVTNLVPKDIPCCTESYRPQVNNFYAGRLWHMSMDSDRIGTNVYYSQVVLNHEDEGQAFQEQDPTAKDFNELVKTDGGVISIPEMGRVLEARNLKDSMLLFADNGVWSISGSYNAYFDATNYTVSKLTDVECVSMKSVCEIEDTIVYASTRGIYIVSSGSRVQSITEQNIHSKYYNISLESKKNIKIVYHKYDKTLHVLYSCSDCPTRYGTELVYNTRSNTWYPYSYAKSIITEAFLTSNNYVRGRGINYLVSEDENVQSHYMTNCEYLDFETKDLAIAYLHTAPETLGDLLFDKKIDRQVFFFDNIVESAALVNHIWDWQNVTKECNTEGVKVTFDNPCLTVASDDSILNKERGVAVSLEMSSIGSQPLKIYGWATKLIGIGEYKPGRADPINRRDQRYKI